MIGIVAIKRYTHLMASETTQRTLTVGEKNSIKNKMALAFMHALNSTVNYHFQENDREMDGLGFDLTLASKTVGTKRTVASGANQINVQLKGVATSSVTMFSEDDTHIKYTLGDDLLQFGLAMFLIVVVLPPENDMESWRAISNDDVLLRARGYYFRVDGRLARGKIKIPKTQQLTPTTYRAMFEAPSEEVQS